MIALVVAVVAAASSPANGDAFAHWPTPDRAAVTRLVVFGHSWAAGRYPDPEVTPWADRVAAGQGLALDNLAVSATDAAQTAETVDAYQPRRGDVVIVEAMLNDVRKYGAPGIRSFRHQTRRILDHLTQGRVRPAGIVVCVDAPIQLWGGSPAFDGYDRGSDVVLSRYGIALRKVAARYRRFHARVVDLGRGWDAREDIGSDGIHPNDAGMGRLADLINRALISLNRPRTTA